MSIELAFAAGDGWLARRDGGVLFISADWPSAVDAFVDAPDASAGRDAVTAAAAGAAFDVPSFVVVTWVERVECVVFGALEVQTDDPTAPMLTAAGSGTWLERRLTVGEAPLGVRAGAPAHAQARLDAGVVPASGFDLRIDTIVDHDDTMSFSEYSTGRDVEMTVAVEPEAVEPVGAVEPVDDGRNHDHVGSPDRGIDALAEAMGDDWMEDSLGLRRPGGGTAAGPEPHGTEEIDEEATWIPERPIGSAAADDRAWVNRPPDPSQQARPAQPLVQARRCFGGHLNPPQAALCRVCGEPIDPSIDPETTHQPLLARARLADGTMIPIDGTIVLGRNPDRSAARVGDDARVVPVSASTAVSRTHVTLRADEWSLTATDCGSRGGVVVVTPGREPVMLEPWIPTEISVGDTIYLGGPTSVHIEPVE